MGTVGMYAGSFDPCTVGHTDVITRASRLFDRLVVAAGNNPAKRYWFPLEQRVHLLEASLQGLSNVTVVSFQGLLVDACRAHGADVIVRGLRALSDFDMEFRNGLANRDLSGLETVFLLTDPSTIFISSSLVKEIAENGGDVSRYVDAPVMAAIRERLGT